MVFTLCGHHLLAQAQLAINPVCGRFRSGGGLVRGSGRNGGGRRSARDIIRGQLSILPRRGHFPRRHNLRREMNELMNERNKDKGVGRGIG